MKETILERHERLRAMHDESEDCWCGPTWETFTECDGTVTGQHLTHTLREK